MNDELKAVRNLGAELGAAKAENEKLRGLLREFCERVERGEVRSKSTYAKFRAALSPQPEPTDTYTAVDMATAAAQGFRDGQAAVEQAPAQDEPQSLNAWFLSLEPGRQAVLREDKWMLANAAFEAGRATRPAQTEQQPVAVIGFYAGEREPRLLSWNKLPNGEHRLYAAPVAQTALSAVTAERDAARRECDENEGAMQVWRRRTAQAEAERDRLLAEVERCAQIAAENAADSARLYAEVEALQVALRLSANRMDRLAIEFEQGSEMRWTASEWAEESRAAMAAKEA